MRPAPAPSTLVVTGQNADLDTMTSRVDPDGARRMMEMLVTLYADRRLAAVREYVSNGVDATRVARSTEPVAVTTPTALEPTLIVADRGVGMTRAEVEATFLAFAASTKHDSDELIGGLGVGAKSAWALSESFLIDTVKDGRRTLVRASRDLSHQVLLSEKPTELPTGTTISIPVEVGHDSVMWQRAVNEVATAHDEGMVIVDGKPVASIAAGPARIGPVLCREGRSKVMIRSGGALFVAGSEIADRVLAVTKLNSCIVELPIGAFDHTPSRESVVATDRTRAAITAALDEFAVAFDALNTEITELAQSDAAAALKLRHSVLGGVGGHHVLPINLSLRVPEDIAAWTIRRNRWTRTSVADRDDFPAAHWGEELERTVIVTEVPRGRPLRGFATYLKDTHPAPRRVIPIPAGQDGVELVVINSDGESIGQTVTIDATMVPEGNAHTHEKWIEVTKTLRAPRGAAAGYQCVLRAGVGDAPASAVLTGAEIAAYGLPVWYSQGDPSQNHSMSSSEPSIGVFLGRRKASRLLAAVPGAMAGREWKSACLAVQTAGWPSTLKLALAADDASFSLIARFRIAAAAGNAIATAGGNSTELLDSIADIRTAMTALTPEQKVIWKEGRDTDVACAARAEVLRLDRALKAAYPLLNCVTGYDTYITREACIEYVTVVAPRSP